MDKDLFEKMENGTIKWGDLLVDEPPVRRSTRKSSKRSSRNSANRAAANFKAREEAAVLEDYIVPDLTMRKGIWENFPVIVDPIPSEDGTNRYAIKWHARNLADWKKSRAATWDEYQEYEFYTEFRLLHALRKFPQKYRLEPPRNRDEIVVIAMVHGEGPRAANAYRGPRLVRLNDIKEHFPVVWKEVVGAPSKTYAIELFGKRIRELSAAAGHDVTEEVKRELLSALAASPSWRLLSGEGPVVARIVMKHL
jgi:hypothetical protein